MSNPLTASQVLVDADTPARPARRRTSRLTSEALPPGTANFPNPFPSALHGNSARCLTHSLRFWGAWQPLLGPEMTDFPSDSR